jgi:hypothetical protein
MKWKQRLKSKVVVLCKWKSNYHITGGVLVSKTSLKFRSKMFVFQIIYVLQCCHLARWCIWRSVILRKKVDHHDRRAIIMWYKITYPRYQMQKLGCSSLTTSFKSQTCKWSQWSMKCLTFWSTFCRMMTHCFSWITVSHEHMSGTCFSSIND